MRQAMRKVSAGYTECEWVYSEVMLKYRLVHWINPSYQSYFATC